MTLIQDILSDDLTARQRRITVNNIYEASFLRSTVHLQSRLVTPKDAISSLSDVYLRFKRAIDNYEIRANTPVSNKVLFTEEDPDAVLHQDHSIIVTVRCIKRMPGAFSQGAPFEGDVKNLKPMLREERDDEEYPGYKLAIYGYFHDNLITLSCWARTNKRANYYADWLEDLMREYAWYFKSEGISRTVFYGRNEDITKTIDGVKWYGRPLDYFVKTEKIGILSQKEIEDIVISTTLADE